MEDAMTAASALSAKGKARRRWVKAGAGTTGVLMTLYSQPGMACTYCGISPSAAISAIGQNKAVGTLSHRGPAAVCNGLPPNMWSSTTRWPSSCQPNDAFYKYFSCSRGSAYAALTCKAVIDGASCDSSSMAKYMMAAYLNVVSGRVNFITVEALQSCWNEWVSKGYYEPMAGQRWYANDIVGYLAGTMD
jgi:hypothetical protein